MSELLPIVSLQTTATGDTIRKRSSPYSLCDTAAATMCFAAANSSQGSPEDLVAMTFDDIGISRADLEQLCLAADRKHRFAPSVRFRQLFGFVKGATTMCLRFVEVYGDLISLLVWHTALRIASLRFPNLSLGTESATLVTALGDLKHAYEIAALFVDKESEDVVGWFDLLVHDNLITQDQSDSITDEIDHAATEFIDYHIGSRIDELISVLGDVSKTQQLPTKFFNFLADMQSFLVKVEAHLCEAYENAVEYM